MNKFKYVVMWLLVYFTAIIVGSISPVFTTKCFCCMIVFLEAFFTGFWVSADI